jgi:tetratricopeptide (TPR) repeat protein
MEPKEEGAPPPKEPRRNWIDEATTQLKSADGLYVGLVSVMTAIAQAWVVIEQKWLISIVTLLLTALCVTLYFLFGRRQVKDDAAAALIRRTALGVLLLTPVLAAVWLYAYSALPRLKEDGNTLAVARFAGPPLPAPYESCRPSAMLVDALQQVAEQYHHFAVFELPYAIAPDGRWAKVWAQGHGSFEAADIIVYGEYTLHESAPGKADEIAITPRFESVPTVPLASEKSAPLQEWETPGSVVKIEALCRGGLRQAGGAPLFLDNAHRLALAIVGAKLFGAQDYSGALEALREAKAVAPERACDAAGTRSSCPGVLAFYLANLDQRAGNYADAEREYLRASEELPNVAAPSIDLGELYARRGKKAEALRAFERAVQTDPGSVAAVATRALYEREYGSPENAALDLDRAQRLQPAGVYDVIALSRALVQRSDGSGCGVKLMGSAVARRDFDKRAMIDAFVAYGVWQERSDPEIATAIFRNALALDPYHVKANYRLGLLLRDEANALAKRPASASAEVTELRRQSRAQFQRAVSAPGFTDEEFLDKGSAAHELGDDAAALRFYERSIGINANAAYAHHHRAEILEARGALAEAGREYAVAAELLPNDALTVGSYAGFLSARANGSPAALRWKNRLRNLASTRFSPDETSTWSASACRYEGLVYPGTD